MKVRVLYFAAARDLAGVDEEAMSVPPEVVDVAGFAVHLAQARPAFAARLRDLRIARNEVFASPEERLEDGDVLAIIPPVAGG